MSLPDLSPLVQIAPLFKWRASRTAAGASAGARHHARLLSVERNASQTRAPSDAPKVNKAKARKGDQEYGKSAAHARLGGRLVRTTGPTVKPPKQRLYASSNEDGPTLTGDVERLSMAFRTIYPGTLRRTGQRS